MNLSNPSYTHSFSLSIADFTLNVHCNHAILAQKLGERYKNFPPVGQETCSLKIFLEGHERKSSLLDTHTNFQGGILYFSAKGFEGQVNEKLGTGHLKLSSSQPVQDVDYFLRVVL